MSSKEIDRAYVLEKVMDKELTLKEASKLLKLSYPQTKRIWSNYKREGRKGLISKKRGQPSNRAVSEDRKRKIASIISNQYQDFKPLFVTEKLRERDNINYSPEFIRQLMIEYHLWIPKQKKQRVYQRRTRRGCFGEMEQIDASKHLWFEDRGPTCHLHIIVDDATSAIVGGYFDLEETTEGYFRACYSYFEQFGRPISLYSDKRSTFKVNHGLKHSKTQFTRAMAELNINMITAHSPQAKGRIERVFGTLQQRLVWEMRLKNISTIEEANVFLPGFIKEYNKTFAKQPANPCNAHRPLNHQTSLKYILCMKEKRCVSKNLEVQFKNQIYQLYPPKELKVQMIKNQITVLETLDNQLIFDFNSVHINYSLYNELPQQETLIEVEDLMKNWKKARGGHRQSNKHPWKIQRNREEIFCMS
jgi:transposase